MAHIMIVDDDEDFAATAGIVLRAAGHEVDLEVDPQTALKSMESKRPDLVILDVMFPEDSSAGFGLARTMQHERESLKDTPILMLTAVNSKFPLGFGESDIDEQWLPITSFLEKPIDFEELQNKVTALLGG